MPHLDNFFFISSNVIARLAYIPFSVKGQQGFDPMTSWLRALTTMPWLLALIQVLINYQLKEISNRLVTKFFIQSENMRTSFSHFRINSSFQVLFLLGS